MEQIKVVNQSFDGTTGSIQFEVPVERLKDVELATGNWSNSGNYGQRYGLRSDKKQTISVPTDRDSQILLAREIADTEPIVANVVDLMVDLCLTGMENRSSDTESKRLFDIICKFGNFDALHRHIFKEYFITSDVFIMRSDPRTVQFGEDKGESYFDYTVLNSRYVTVTGPLVFGAEKIGIMPNDELKKAVQDSDSKLLKSLPSKLKSAIKNNEPFYPAKEGKISRISRKRQPYERYATPFIARVYAPVLLKWRMREADLAVTETVRNVLVTVTIGDKDFPATQLQLDTINQLFSNPSKTMELFWNHTLKVDYHYPEADLFNTEKYNQVNSDIIQGLGIPPVLIDGGGGTFATAWTSLLSVMERLDAARNQVARWQEEEYYRIAEELGLNVKEIPKVVFKPLNLRDDKIVQTLMLELYNRKLISRDTLLSFAGLDLEEEVRKLTVEEDTSELTEVMPRIVVSDTGGRPTDQVDQGDYTPRDKTAPVDNDSPEN